MQGNVLMNPAILYPVTAIFGTLAVTKSLVTCNWTIRSGGGALENHPLTPWKLSYQRFIRKKLISDVQFHTLMGKIDEERRIDNMYNIRDYQLCKRDGIPWTKKPDVPDFRRTIKEMVGGVKASFQNQGYQFYVN